MCLLNPTYNEEESGEMNKLVAIYANSINLFNANFNFSETLI